MSEGDSRRTVKGGRGVLHNAFRLQLNPGLRVMWTVLINTERTRRDNRDIAVFSGLLYCNMQDVTRIQLMSQNSKEGQLFGSTLS